MSKVHFYSETKFRKTEIGEVPEEWEVRKLGEIAHLEGGQSAPQGERYFQNGKYPFIRVQHISNEHKITGYDLINSQAIKDYRLKLFPKGSIIFPKSGASIFQEKRAILPFDSYVVSHLCVVIPDKGEANNLFLYYVLVRKKLAENISHNYPSLRISELGKVLIPLPPLEEQKAIARVLKDFDDLIEVIDKKIETYKRIKKKLMEIYFTRGVFEHKTFKDTERIPERWDYKPLKYIIKDSFNGDWGKDLEFEDSIKVKVIRGTDFPSIRRKDFSILNERFIKKSKVNKLKLKPKDILIEISGGSDKQPTGRIIMIEQLPKEEIFIFSNFVRKIILTPEVWNEFFFYYWEYLYFKNITSLYENRTTNIRNFRFNDFIKNIKIPLPPLEEQKEIAKRLKAIDDQIENLRKQKEHLQKVKKKFMDLLLTGKLRIKIN